MPAEADPAELIGRDPDQRLLSEDLSQLPDTVGEPEQVVPSRARGRIVAVGATLTGLSLVLGAALTVLGAVVGLADGLGAAAIAALLVGLVLLGTHWGWVHVAEISANALDERRNRDVIERNRGWLDRIEPYTRWSVSTSTGPDGSITIETIRYRPVPSGDGRFTFVRDVADREVHPGDAPAAMVAERAELLRRRAAEATAGQRARYEAAHDVHERMRLAEADEAERLAAVRAASQALSDQINTHLRDPPLTP